MPEPSFGADTRPSERLARLFARARLWLSAAFLLYALVNFAQAYRGSSQAMVWGPIFIAASVALVVRWPLVRRCVGWSAAAAMLQAVIWPLLVDTAYFSLPANLQLNVDTEARLAGISGVHRITTDQLGFRVTKPHDYARAGGIRIFAIGASTTEQIVLDDRKTWTHLLQERLTRSSGREIDVINTGLAGLRAVNHAATLKRIGALKPDAAIFLMGVNDWNAAIMAERRRQRWGRTADLVAAFADTVRPIAMESSPLGGVLRAIRERGFFKSGGGTEATVNLAKYLEGRQNTLARLPLTTVEVREVEAAYRRSVDRIIELCTDMKIRCAFATQPYAYHAAAPSAFRAAWWMTPPDTDFVLSPEALAGVAQLYNGFLAGYGRLRGVDVCDIAEKLPKSFEAFYDDIHFNENGARLVAQHLGACLDPLMPAWSARAVN